MNRLLSATLITLSYTALIGLGAVWGAVGEFGSLSNSGSTPSPNRASERGKGDAPYERWTSCTGLIYPVRTYSVSDLEVMFEKPVTARQVLQNLKLAWDRDLLLQPSFFDPEILDRFFAGAAVTWVEPSHPLSQDVGFVVGQLDSSAVPGMIVKAESRCWRTNSKSGDRARSQAIISGHLRLFGRPFPEMNLRVIRDVFGPEAENTIDQGISNHGLAYTPIYKGVVVYSDHERSSAESVAVETTFFFRLGPTLSDAQSIGKIADDDVVEAVEMHETHHRLLEK